MRSTLICLALIACGGGESKPDAAQVPVDAPVARQTVMETKSLLVGDLVEATLTGGPGDSAVISLDAPVAKLDWNIHGHAGGSSQTVKEELLVMSVRYTFSPTAAAPWSLLLRNRDTAAMSVTVKIELFGNMQWSGWQ